MLCVDLIGPYTLKGKNRSAIDYMFLTMTDPAGSWFKIMELPVAEYTPTAVNSLTMKTPNTKEVEPYFDKSSEQIISLKYRTWYSIYPCCQKIIYNDGSKFKLHFQGLCKKYGIKCKPTSVKTPQANAILEKIGAVLMTMLCTAELNVAKSSLGEALKIALKR